MLYFQTVGKNRFEHITDNELLEKFYQDRNNEWLGIALQRYTLLLLGVCMKYLKNEESAKDAVQQIFLKAITELNKYRVDYLKSWLYMIARNHCLMILRNKKILVTIEDNNHLVAPELIKSTINQKEIALDLLEKSLHELNTEQKSCVTLFYLEKKSYQEIVESTGYNLLQVKSYIQNGKRNLRLLVEKQLNKLND